MGIPFLRVDPNTTTITDAMFDHSKFSAFAVASEFTCGGCDNDPADNAAIATHLSAIASFVDAGGGILGLAGAADPLAYAYVPEAAANGGGSPPSTGYVETAAGLAAGLVAENGDPTHNFFPTPGTDGLSAAYQVAEINNTPGFGNPVESVFIKGATITCTGQSCTVTGTPLPAALPLFGAAVGAAGLFGRWRRNRCATV
jgi:hypothetical protein